MTGNDPAARRAAIAREHGSRALEALDQIDTVLTRAEHLAARGNDWYNSDTDHVPWLACEALIIKVGDAATRIPAPLREQHPEIPWTTMSDMRNQLTHGHDVTDYDVVWDTIENDFPDVHHRVHTIFGSAG